MCASVSSSFQVFGQVLGQECGQVVGQVVPRFLKQLKADYEVWSLGDDSRKAVCEGGLFDVDQSKSNPEMCDVSSKEEDEQD